MAATLPDPASGEVPEKRVTSLLPHTWRGRSCARCRHDWLRSWSREGHQLTQLEELGGRKETRLKVITPETLQTK